MGRIAAVTMVRDDAFFLDIWLRHYGGLLGRENCYVVNHGRGAGVAQQAAGCNIIGIPGDPHPNFDMKRWRLLNNIVMGLRSYYDHVIVGDVDEIVITDPDCGKDLAQWISDQPTGRVLTPVGLEVIHRIDIEHDAIGDHVLGPRRHVRPAPHYSKPCIISAGTKIARGGHFTQYDKLHAPDELYLLHLKFCDIGVYAQAMDNRNAVAAATGAHFKDASIGRHWFAEMRGEDRAVFDAFITLDEQETFNTGPIRRRMYRSWKPRGDSGFWQFDRPDYAMQYLLPERFSGLV